MTIKMWDMREASNTFVDRLTGGVDGDIDLYTQEVKAYANAK